MTLNVFTEKGDQKPLETNIIGVCETFHIYRQHLRREGKIEVHHDEKQRERIYYRHSSKSAKISRMLKSGGSKSKSISPPGPGECLGQTNGKDSTGVGTVANTQTGDPTQLKVLFKANVSANGQLALKLPHQINATIAGPSNGNTTQASYASKLTAEENGWPCFPEKWARNLEAWKAARARRNDTLTATAKSAECINKNTTRFQRLKHINMEESPYHELNLAAELTDDMREEIKSTFQFLRQSQPQTVGKVVRALMSPQQVANRFHFLREKTFVLYTVDISLARNTVAEWAKTYLHQEMGIQVHIIRVLNKHCYLITVEGEEYRDLSWMEYLYPESGHSVRTCLIRKQKSQEGKKSKAEQEAKDAPQPTPRLASCAERKGKTNRQSITDVVTKKPPSRFLTKRSKTMMKRKDVHMYLSRFITVALESSPTQTVVYAP
ncbi:hypothetical protein R1sor_015795 [Riccia sorocarpa]|uniref:Uncharacterized protein n=1 Tax=Riccia sorocarpa TaxID=122646 RepID=A0ABD3HHD8_9MARC